MEVGSGKGRDRGGWGGDVERQVEGIFCKGHDDTRSCIFSLSAVSRPAFISCNGKKKQEG